MHLFGPIYSSVHRKLKTKTFTNKTETASHHSKKAKELLKTVNKINPNQTEKNEWVQFNKAKCHMNYRNIRDGLGQNPTRNLTRPEAFLANPTRATFSRTRVTRSYFF